VKRIYVVVRGRVQGVGFRDATQREARRLSLNGWVRNRLDGNVEVTAEGPEAALTQLETFLRRGPRLANVDGVDVFWDEPQRDLAAFEIR
jgi:acylphosphatase